MFMSLGRLLFDKKRLLNIIVIIQLGIALIIANVLIGNYNKIYQSYNFTKNYDDSVGFFTLELIKTEPETSIDYDLLATENTYIEFFARRVEGSRAQIFCYGENTCEGLKSQLKKGEWSIDKNCGTVIDCVVIGNGYEIGDTFTESVGSKTFTFRVSGTLGDKAMIINPGRRSSVMSAEMLFYEYNANKNGTAIICSSDALSDAAGTYGDSLAFGLTDISDEHLRNRGNLFTMPEMRKNSDEDLSYTASGFLPLALAFCLVGLASAVCMAFMNLLANKKVFDVYFRVGMRKIDAFLLNLGYMCWVIFGIVIVTLFLFIFCNLTGITDSESYLAGFNNYLFSLGYLLAIAFGTSASSLLILKPTDISKS